MPGCPSYNDLARWDSREGAMASINSDSKVTRVPSAAKAASGSPQSQRAVAASTPPASSANDFDPSSSFFPHTLPGGEPPTSSSQRVPSRGKRLWLLAALLLVAGSSLYYVQRQAQDHSASDSGSAGIPAVDAAKAARPDKGVVRQGPQSTAQGRVTHTLPASAPPPKPAAGRSPDTQLVASPAEKAAEPLRAMKDPVPHVTHTRPDPSTGEDR